MSKPYSKEQQLGSNYLNKKIKPTLAIKKTKKLTSSNSEMSYKEAVKFADTYFSLYIRLKDADQNGIVDCFTCPARLHYTQMDCGHNEKRSFMGTRYDERNCKPQDKGCNQFKHGNRTIFRGNLQDIYGENILEELYRKREAQYSTAQLILIGQSYKEKVSDLKKQSILLVTAKEEVIMIEEKKI